VAEQHAVEGDPRADGDQQGGAARGVSSGQGVGQPLLVVALDAVPPLRELFALLRGPDAAGARWRGLLVVAIDGTIMTVADSEANLAVYSRQHGGPNGGSSYPMLWLLALVSCGTRTVIDAVFGPLSSGETTYAASLLASLREGMVLLADRNFGAGFLAAQIAAAGAEFLIRVRTGNNSPKLPVLRRLPDGSGLSRFGGIPVRVIDAEITITTSAGHATGGCRLITTLTDPARYPAGDLAVLYHERWQIEALLDPPQLVMGADHELGRTDRCPGASTAWAPAVSPVVTG
jgi:hypothetical protein